jgi:hypothetical protein
MSQNLEIDPQIGEIAISPEVLVQRIQSNRDQYQIGPYILSIRIEDGRTRVLELILDTSGDVKSKRLNYNLPCEGVTTTDHWLIFENPNSTGQYGIKLLRGGAEFTITCINDENEAGKGKITHFSEPGEQDKLYPLDSRKTQVIKRPKRD